MLLTHYNDIRAKRLREERGFTLVELLVVVVIIGVLVAIAIPVYMNYQNNAKKKAVESDVRNAIPAVVQCISDNGGVQAGLNYTEASDSAPGKVTCDGTTKTVGQPVNHSEGVTLKFIDGDNGAYSIEGSREDPDYTVTYDSSTGQTVKTDSVSTD